MPIVRVSFDFDGVLSRPAVQRFAGELRDAGVEIWITTMRFASDDALRRGSPPPDYGSADNTDLFRVAKALRVPAERILFTNWEWKSAALRGRGFLFHLDDCPETLAEIAANGDTRGVLYGPVGWRRACRRVLDLPA